MTFIYIALLFLASLFPLILIHELGHALVAKALGFRVFGITLGYGKRLLEIKPFGLRITLNRYPVNGHTLAFPRTDSWPRLRMWLVVLGGPATHIGFILIYVLDLVPSQILHLSDQLNVYEVFLYSNVVLLICSLFLWSVGRDGFGEYSDGHNLITIPFVDPKEYVGISRHLPHLEAVELLNQGDFAGAVAKLEALIASAPDDKRLKHDLAIGRLGFGEYEQGLLVLNELLDSGGLDDETTNIFLKNSIAYLITVLNKVELLAEADRYSLEAYKFAPKFPHFIGTRGSFLIRTGQLASGLALLRESYRCHSERSSRAQNACFIALGAAKNGEFAFADQWFEIARKEFAACKIIELIEGEVRELRGELSDL